MNKFILAGMVVIVVAAGVLGYTYFKNPQKSRNQYVVKEATLEDVLGTTTKKSSADDNSDSDNKSSIAVPLLNTSSQTVQTKIEELKKEAAKVDVQEIASSSPQVQKVLNDLKALENAPKNQAKQTCQQICNSL